MAKTLDQRLAAAKLIKDETIPNANTAPRVGGAMEDINNAWNEELGEINVTTAFPPTSGYHTPETARAAVPESYKRKGRTISYQTAAGTWVKEQYRGDSTAAWTTASNWFPILMAADQNVYNVTTQNPLAAGEYYNPTTARAAVPNQIRKLNLGLKYLSGYKEIDTLTITGPALTDGSISIFLNGVKNTASPVIYAGDTAIDIATKIRLMTWAGWTVGGTPGTAVVTFTRTTYDPVSAPTFSNTAGITANFVRTSTGQSPEWIHEEFIGPSTASWTTATNWRKIATATDLAQIETDLNAIEQEQIQGGVYDVSSHNDGAVFESLSTLLGSANLSTLIPTSVRRGGMSIRFIQSSDNKYVQYLYMGTATTGTHNPFLDEANWQGVDDVKSDISTLQKRTLDFIEGYPTKFVEINNLDRFTIKPQTTAYYGGKNFFKFEDIPETTINGITYSVTNGVITLNGNTIGGTYLPLNAATISIDSTGQLNLKVWRDGGSVSGNFSFELYENRNASGTQFCIASVYSSFAAAENISDVEGTVKIAPNNKGYLFLVAASGISFDNLIIRPMLTLADRYKAGDYSYGKTPKKITEETVVRGAEYCCVQAHTDFSIVSEMAKSDSLQKSIYGMDIKASSGKILKILDGVPFSNLVSADTESVRIKVVGKNLINYKGWFEAITGNPLIYQPIALRPNTTYIFTNKGTDLTHLSGTIQVRYGGITDTTSTLLATILGDENVQELSFTTPNYNGQYYLRYYGNLCAKMSDGTHGDFSTMMLVEGDTPLEYFEEYVEGDYLKDSARLSKSDISYVYTDNLDTITIEYYSRIGSKGMPYYWQDYMDAKKMDLRKKLLSMSMHGLAFSFFTDVHIDENTCNSAYLLDYLRDEVGIPFKVFGGDLLNYSNNKETELIIQYYRFRKLYVNDKATFCTPGNHDFYSPMGRNIFYNALVKPIELLFDTNGYNTIERTYFYIDNSSQKVRMIFLDSNDWNSEKPVMFNWYVKALNSIPNGWDCVIFSHILEKGTYFGNDIPFFAKEYNDRTSGSHALGDRSATITYDFASGTGKVICAIGGHSHKDYSNTDFGFPVILTTTDCVGGLTVTHPTVPMTKGTTTENALDVFFINLDAKTIDAIRVGAGEDRHWTY